MKIMLIGYGKMGRTIENSAKSRGHEISHIIDVSNQEDLKNIRKGDADVAIEFTQPESAVRNLRTCMLNGIPVVCGTTGWLDHRPEIEQLCKDTKGAFFYASNYSIGVNIFFCLNEKLAEVMKQFPEYRADIEEIHHTEKKDSPSGTAITLAEGLLENYPAKKSWVNHPSPNAAELSILSKRIPNVPGTHTIHYTSAIDTIEITHTAHSREGFASGAVLAAEFLHGKQGVFGMNDLLAIQF
jgi:4-hydroxy-tetrahydrodipicolinate reductase